MTFVNRNRNAQCDAWNKAIDTKQLKAQYQSAVDCIVNKGYRYRGYKTYKRVYATAVKYASHFYGDGWEAFILTWLYEDDQWKMVGENLNSHDLSVDPALLAYTVHVFSK